MTNDHWIDFSGKTRLLRLSDDAEETDGAVLRLFDGAEAKGDGDVFSDYLEDPECARAGVRGGLVTLCVDEAEKGLRVVTRYGLSMPLSEEGVRRLAEFTFGQWADGFGSSDEVHSGLPGRVAPGRGLCVSVWSAADTRYTIRASWFAGPRLVDWELVTTGGKRARVLSFRD